VSVMRFVFSHVRDCVKVFYVKDAPFSVCQPLFALQDSLVAGMCPI